MIAPLILLLFFFFSVSKVMSTLKAETFLKISTQDVAKLITCALYMIITLKIDAHLLVYIVNCLREVGFKNYNF